MTAHQPEPGHHQDDTVSRTAAPDVDLATGEAADGPSMVLRAEELRAGVELVPTKRVRLRKYVVEEETTVPVTLRHEVVEVIEEPLTGADAVAVPGGLGGGLDEGGAPRVIEMIVHREEPRVEIDVVATERIRLTRYVVVDHVEITRNVASEAVEVLDERTPGRGAPSTVTADGAIMARCAPSTGLPGPLS